jgi:hypothetical protein
MKPTTLKYELKKKALVILVHKIERLSSSFGLTHKKSVALRAVGIFGKI